MGSKMRADEYPQGAGRICSAPSSRTAALGIGVTQVPEFFSGMPQIVSDIFAGNPVAGVFVVAMILSLALPKKVKAEDVGALTDETLDTKKPE